MGKKILSGIFVVCILLMGAVLTLGILVAGPAPAGANEVLSKTPSLTDRDGKFNTSVLSDTADWLADHFFGRQELISCHNRLCTWVFGNSPSEDVILGKEGWLYYASTLDDYTGTKPMTQQQLFWAGNNLKLMAQYCQENGREFVFVIAPNKNALYPQYMPDFAVVADGKNAQRLHQWLEENAVPYVDLFAAFADQPGLYFAHDSHWNSKGAALGADVINGALGVKSNYFADGFSKSAVHSGDLYEMLYPAFADTEQNPIYGGQLKFTYTSKATKPDSITLLTHGEGEHTLLCYRDSFGNLLYPYLADSYADARFSRSTAYDLTQAGDRVVIELVERNLAYLYTYLPVMPAPERTVSLPEAAGTISVEVKTVKQPENFLCVQGALPVASEAQIYVVCEGGVYEAFCLKDNGFGAYVPAGQTVLGIAYYQNGELRYLTAQ